MAAARLYATTSAAENWHAVAGPWLRGQAATAWKETRPTVVLAPSRSEGFYLRSRLVAEEVPSPGVRFWTPSDARKFLREHYLPGLGAATQAELRLVARARAERLARGEGADQASLRSVAREPAAFLRAYDLLAGAGWNPARDGAVYGRALALEMQGEMTRSGIATQAGLHRALRREASATPRRLIANLLVTGFNAAHWPLWDLLKAVVISAEQAVVALAQPRVFGETVDQLWNGSWEEFAQTEAVIPDAGPDEAPAPFAEVAGAYERGAAFAGASLDMTFCVASDLAAQTRGVVLQAIDYLQRDDCARLGIIFPEANALALGVAEELQRLNIPMNNGPGWLTPGRFEKRCWRTWLALQEEPGVTRLIEWLRACEADGVAFEAERRARAETVARVVDGALGESLVDDLDFLAAHLGGQPNKNDARAVAEFLRRRVALPEEATFARYLEVTREALALPGWEPFREQMETEPPAWLREREAPLSRRTFLEWLRESNDSQTRERGREANHFYGKAHLLVYGQLSGQGWTHLILTGLNEGVWPRVFEAGAFGSRHELEALNQQARALNRRVKATGAKGEGQAVVRDGFGHCLLPLERHDLALRDLCAALEATQRAVCLAAMATEAGRGLLPSDFFNHAYQAKTGRVLDDEGFRRMANATEKWCRKHDSLFAATNNISAARIEATRIADQARRDPTRPFGAYEFAHDEPPERPIQLWCKAWEEAWNQPAKIWLEEVVGAAPWPEGKLNWPGAVGTWVHQWMAQALREGGERGSAPLVPRVGEAAEGAKRRARERAERAGIELYPWWEQVWAQARTVVIGLAENLEPALEGWTHVAEYRLPRGIMTALPGSGHADFELKGRIDLLLMEPGTARIDPTEGNFSGAKCWVVDFKTGAAKSLKDMADGRGLQTLLYAMALRSLGAGATAISLLTRNAALKEQAQLDDVLREGALFRSLEIMHRGGIFGMRPAADSDYGFAAVYPLATRLIPKHVLEAKWALAHGGVAGDEEDDA